MGWRTARKFKVAHGWGLPFAYVGACEQLESRSPRNPLAVRQVGQRHLILILVRLVITGAVFDDLVIGLENIPTVFEKWCAKGDLQARHLGRVYSVFPR